MKKILILNSNYYKDISKNLFFNAKKKLSQNNFLVHKLDVPGVYEIPIAIKRNIKKYDGFVALGCVIKGETPHFDLICSSVFNSILSLSINYNKPIGNGIITASEPLFGLFLLFLALLFFAWLRFKAVIIPLPIGLL